MGNVRIYSLATLTLLTMKVAHDGEVLSLDYGAGEVWFGTRMNAIQHTYVLGCMQYAYEACLAPFTSNTHTNNANVQLRHAYKLPRIPYQFHGAHPNILRPS